MDNNNPTSTVIMDRSGTVIAPKVERPGAPAPQGGDPDRKKMFVAISFVLSIAIMLCLCATMVTEIIYKINGDTGFFPARPGNVSYTEKAYSADMIHKGDLILVKEGYEYAFPPAGETDIVAILGNKNSSYIVRNGEQSLEESVITRLNAFMSALAKDTGCTDVQVYNGYRSFETQRDSYEKYEDEVKAGFSEHHTGTSFDLNLYTGKKLQDDPAVWNYISANAHKYGFIDRYPDEKKDITGVYHDFTMLNSARPTHFRYVGYPHAYYMMQNDLCLEEYLTEISTKYKYEGEHLIFKGDNGNTYEVYYVESVGASTNVPVPEGYDYTVSGDNMNGFIVTVCFSAKS